MIVDELKNRAIKYVESQNEEVIDELEKLGVEQELIDFVVLQPEYLLKLAEYGVKTIEDLGELDYQEFRNIVPDNVISKQEMEKLNFSTNRYINAHKDYYEYHKRRRSFHKSFKTDNNDLKIYSDLNNKGIINFLVDSSYNLKYTIKDTYGNTSVLRFKIKSTSKETIKPIKNTNAKALSEYKVEEEGFKVIMEEKEAEREANKEKEEELKKKKRRRR